MENPWENCRKMGKVMGKEWEIDIDPLVKGLQFAMENHHFSWDNWDNSRTFDGFYGHVGCLKPR